MPRSSRIVLGRNIREWRRKRGLSQEALANEAGIHRTYLPKIEAGKVNVSVDTIDKIARALHVDPQKLFTP